MLETKLNQHVLKPAHEIGIREVLNHRVEYEETVDHITDQLQSSGFAVETQEFEAGGANLQGRHWTC